MRGLLVVLGLVACGDGATERPARLELVNDQFPFARRSVAFDADNRLVLMDGSIGLQRLEGDRLVPIPGTGAFAFGAFGVDRDGTLLVGGFGGNVLARLEGDRIVQVGPPAPNTPAAPVAAPSGSYYLHPESGDALVLAPGATVWMPTPRDLSRSLRAPDGTLYAIVDGDVATIDASDAAVAVASCAEFAGGECGRLAPIGVGGDGELYVTGPGSRSVLVLDPGAASLRELTMPGKLFVTQGVAGVEHTVLVAADPERGNEISLWLVRPGGDSAERFFNVSRDVFDGVQLIADREGSVYVALLNQLHVVVPAP